MRSRAPDPLPLEDRGVILSCAAYGYTAFPESGCDHQLEAEATCKALGDKGLAGRCHPVAVDVSKRSDVEHMAQQIKDEAGQS